MKRCCLFAIFFFLFLSGSAQKGVDRITISDFNKPHDIALLDTIKQTLVWNGYEQFISNEKVVFAKDARDKSFGPVNKLLNKLSSNGNDDISKCFYPRHSINFYKEGRLVKYVLICFECHGIRFSDERWVTKVKKEEKRLTLMEELKAYFISEGL